MILCVWLCVRACIRVCLCGVVFMWFYVAMRCILLQNTIVKLVSFEWLRSKRNTPFNPMHLGRPQISMRLRPAMSTHCAAHSACLRAASSCSRKNIQLGALGRCASNQNVRMMLLYTELACLDARHAEAPMCFI